jgi:hypothetical protein
MKAKIVSNVVSEHEFKVGTNVVCEKIEEDDDFCYYCHDVDNSLQSWWVDPIDLEIIEE